MFDATPWHSLSERPLTSSGCLATKYRSRRGCRGNGLPQTNLFIGSSSAAKSQAKAVIHKFTSATLKFLPWWDAFTPGKTLLEDLDTIRGQVDGAVLIFSPEPTSKIRGKSVELPNLNVLFEFGYFCGHIGKQKVSIIKYGDYYLPSDLGDIYTYRAAPILSEVRLSASEREPRTNSISGFKFSNRDNRAHSAVAKVMSGRPNPRYWTIMPRGRSSACI
jgi:hypothetical protein